MVEILLAVAAAQSEYKARQCGQIMPELGRSERIRFAGGLTILALIVAGISLLGA